MLQRVYAEVNATVTDPLTTFFGGPATLSKVFGAAMNVIMGVAVSLSVIFLGLGGIKYITAKGDAKAAEEARSWLTNAVIGLVVALGALAVRQIALGILGTTAGNVETGGNIVLP